MFSCTKKPSVTHAGHLYLLKRSADGRYEVVHDIHVRGAIISVALNERATMVATVAFDEVKLWDVGQGVSDITNRLTVDAHRHDLA